MALNFLPLKFTREQIQDIFNNPETQSFNRIALQFYTTNGTDFSLVAQVLSASRTKIGPPVIFVGENTGTPATTSRDFVFCQYEISKSQLRKLCKDFTQDVTFRPIISSINPESVDYDLNNGETTLNPSPPAPPPAEP